MWSERSGSWNLHSISPDRSVLKGMCAKIGDCLSKSMMCTFQYCLVTKKARAYMLLNLADCEAIQHEKAFTYETGESKESVETLKSKFEEICKPKPNITMERHAFNKRVQAPGESVKPYIAELKIKASTCKFGSLKEEMIRDRLVVGIRSDEVRRLLLRAEDLRLEKARDICEINEISDIRVKLLSNPPQAVDSMKTRSSQDKPHASTHSNAKTYKQQFQKPKVDSRLEVEQCGNCGNSHERNKCPAYGKRCKGCGNLTISTRCVIQEGRQHLSRINYGVRNMK